MSHGPTLLYDKSAIQRLSAEEADWLTHFFQTIITPVYQLEILGNLSKQQKKGSPEARVSSLAARSIGLGSIPNIPHDELISSEILGNPVEMGGMPIVAAEKIVAANGEVSAFIDESPEERTLKRWGERNFSAAEREHAFGIRRRAKSNTALHDLVQATKRFKQKGTRYANTLPDLLGAVDAFLDQPTAQFRALSTALEMFDQPESSRRHVKAHWIAYGRPPIRYFLPYTHFCMRLSMLFMHGVGLGIIGQRPTNLMDLQYLYYLPFCMVFTSADRLHMDLAPLFIGKNQRFVASDLMQAALRELVAYYREHKAELKAQGIMNFAAYPPLDRHTLIHDLYDSLMPRWREDAAEPKVPISREDNARIMERLGPMIDAIEAAQRAKIDDENGA